MASLSPAFLSSFLGGSICSSTSTSASTLIACLFSQRQWALVGCSVVGCGSPDAGMICFITAARRLAELKNQTGTYFAGRSISEVGSWGRDVGR
jgi:hypothetical protein